MDIIFSIEEIKEAAKKFLPLLDQYKIFGFSGELGAGKTTFIGNLCRELGVVENVTSPTYSLIKEYETKDGNTIYHMDLYRIKNKEEAIEAGIDDCLNGDDICLVEWPEIVPEILPLSTVFCKLKITGNDTRKLSVELPA